MNATTTLPELRRRVELLLAQAYAPGTTAERFSELLVRGVRALDAASYGIAAAFVVRDDGTELTFFGHNTIAGGDPAGHAEMNAIGAATKLLALPEFDRVAELRHLHARGDVAIRACSPSIRDTTLYSTLEPCPMCTVATINAGIGRAIYAHEDPVAGALAAPRLRRLAPIWQDLAQTIGLRAVCCQTVDDRDEESYLPADLLALLDEIFVASRRRLDTTLAKGGFFHPYDLVRPAARSSGH
jgi:tRNA(Arg) A34 adenosine deaminase TadA